MAPRNKNIKVNETTTAVTSTQGATVIDLASLTPEALAKIQKQLKAMKKADMGDHKQWVAIVDTMLHEKDGAEFKWTTADILSALVAKALVNDKSPTYNRNAEIKRIQTRKQLLEKKIDDTTKVLHVVGYKASSNAFGPLTADRIIEWLNVPSNIEAVSVKQADSIIAALKVITG